MVRVLGGWVGSVGLCGMLTLTGWYHGKMLETGRQVAGQELSPELLGH